MTKIKLKDALKIYREKVSILKKGYAQERFRLHYLISTLSPCCWCSSCRICLAKRKLQRRKNPVIWWWTLCSGFSKAWSAVNSNTTKSVAGICLGPIGPTSSSTPSRGAVEMSWAICRALSCLNRSAGSSRCLRTIQLWLRARLCSGIEIVVMLTFSHQNLTLAGLDLHVKADSFQSSTWMLVRLTVDSCKGTTYSSNRASTRFCGVALTKFSINQ